MSFFQLIEENGKITGIICALIGFLISEIRQKIKSNKNKKESYEITKVLILNLDRHWLSHLKLNNESDMRNTLSS